MGVVIGDSIEQLLIDHRIRLDDLVGWGGTQALHVCFMRECLAEQDKAASQALVGFLQLMGGGGNDLLITCERVAVSQVLLQLGIEDFFEHLGSLVQRREHPILVSLHRGGGL